MKPSRENITFSVVVSLTLVLAVVEWFWLFPSMPDEDEVIALYAEHKQEFADLAKILEKGCPGQAPPEALVVARRVKSQPDLVCSGERNARLILGVKGFLLAIGPVEVIGLTYIPGNTKRVGDVVPVLAPHIKEVGTVYLRPVEGRWYVFYQNTD